MDILIIWGTGIAFLIVIALINKKRGVVKTGERPFHYLHDTESDIGRDIDLPGGIGYHNKDKF